MVRKFTVYALIMSGVSILFYYGGLLQGNPLLTALLDPGSLPTSTLWLTITAALFTVGVAAFIGIYTKNVELAVATVYVPFIATVLWNFIDVYNVMRAENVVLANLAFSAVFLLFTITLFEFWRK